MHILNLLRGALVVGSIVAVAAAENGPPEYGNGTSPGLEVVTVAERRKIVGEEGLAAYVPAEQLRIGDEIFYTVRVRNISDADVTDPIVIKSVPRNTRYVADSAVGPAAQVSFSIDGGSAFGAADQLAIMTASGSRPAVVDDFTHIRWQLRHPLAPGAIALLRFRGVFR